MISETGSDSTVTLRQRESYAIPVPHPIPSNSPQYTTPARQRYTAGQRTSAASESPIAARFRATCTPENTPPSDPEDRAVPDGRGHSLSQRLRGQLSAFFTARRTAHLAITAIGLIFYCLHHGAAAVSASAAGVLASAAQSFTCCFSTWLLAATEQAPPNRRCIFATRLAVRCLALCC